MQLFEAPLDEKEISLRYSSALVQGATNVFWYDCKYKNHHYFFINSF
jgi:hypothetical protein